MAGDNITPIYGEWLYQHISYYQFHGKDAEDLRKRILAIDVTKAESDRELVECYRRFVELFVNDMFQVAFAPPAEGITTRRIKAFLVNNAYNVMAPIEFLEENGMKAEYNLDERVNHICSVLNGGSKTSTVGFDAVREDTDRIAKWKRSESATIFRGLLVLVLGAFILWKSYSYIPMIRSAMVGNLAKVLWVFVLLVIIVGFVKGVAELRAGMRRQKFLNTVQKCANYSITANENQASRSNDVTAQIVEYRNIIKDALEKGAPAELPMPAKKLNTNNTGIEKEVQMLKAYIDSAAKMKRKAGKLLLLCQVIIVIFLVTDTDMLSGKFDFANRNEDSDYESEQNMEDAPMVGEAYVQSTVASSQLSSAKTGYVYGSDYTIDKDWDTCWQDGSDTDGTGEWITYVFDNSYNLLNMNIVNGRVSSEDKYYANGRVESGMIYLYQNEQLVYEQEFWLEDSFNYMQCVPISVQDGIACDMAQIWIGSVYQGHSYNDLCITEVSFDHLYY